MNDPDRKWTVEHWMTDIALAVPPHTDARSAMLKMHIGGFRHLPVVEGGHLVGIVSDRDLLGSDSGKSARDPIAEGLKVSDLMSRDPETVLSSQPLEMALGKLLEHKYSALPVVDDQLHLVGILTSHDVARASQEALASLRNL